MLFFESYLSQTLIEIMSRDAQTRATLSRWRIQGEIDLFAEVFWLAVGPKRRY